MTRIKHKESGRMGHVVGYDTKPCHVVIQMDGAWAPQTIHTRVFDVSFEKEILNKEG